MQICDHDAVRRISLLRPGLTDSRALMTGLAGLVGGLVLLFHGELVGGGLFLLFGTLALGSLAKALRSAG